jgi:hypothetical protein
MGAALIANPAGILFTILEETGVTMAQKVL